VINLESLLRRFTGQDPTAEDGARPAEILLPELGLKLLNVGSDRVRVFSTWAQTGLFRVQGQLGGPPERGDEVRVPLQGRTALSVSVAPAAPRATPELVRSSLTRLPPDTQQLEFLFLHGDDEIRLTFRLSDQVPVDDFEPLRDTRPLFRTLPAVEEMSVILANLARAQATTLSLLENLAAQAGRHATREMVAELRASYPPLAELASRGVRQLHTYLDGRSLSEVAALALFAELEQGLLTLSELREAAREGQPPPVSQSTLTLVCNALTEEPHGELERVLRQPPARRVRDLLDEAGRLTSSNRVSEFTGGHEVLPHHRELHRVLGARVELPAVAALATFVDVEAGLKGPTLYSLAAVAGAYGVPLRGMQCPASDLAPAGVLAEFTDAATRQVRWVESPAEAERLRQEGLDFTGHVLAREPAPDWSPLTQEQLLGGTGSLSRPAQTLERLYGALRQVLHERPEYQPVSPDSWKEVVRQLKTGYFKSLLGDVVPPERLTPLLADLASRAPEELEILPFLEALGDADPTCLALELLGPSLEAEGLNGLLYQRMRRDRLGELLRSKNTRARRAAVSMLCTAGFDGELAHELRRLREEPELAAAADAALAQVALGGAVPFPAAVRRAGPPEAPEPDSSLGRQLEELWPKLGELAPSRRREALRRAAACVEEAGRRPALARLLDGLNHAFREDQDKAVVLLCLLKRSELTARRMGSLQKWKFFAFARGKKLAALLLETPSDRVWNDYLEFQQQSEAVLANSPTRLGSGQPVPLYRCRRPLGPWEREGELSAFFMDLVTLAADVPVEELRVCRIRASLPPVESHFFWDVAIDPRLVDVYEPAAGRFTPQLHHHCLRPAEVGYEDDDWLDFEALVTLFTESRPAFRQLPRLAREVAQTFELPPQSARQVLKMLVDLGADSAYEF